MNTISWSSNKLMPNKKIENCTTSLKLKKNKTLLNKINYLSRLKIKEKTVKIEK